MVMKIAQVVIIFSIAFKNDVITYQWVCDTHLGLEARFARSQVFVLLLTDSRCIENEINGTREHNTENEI